MREKELEQLRAANALLGVAVVLFAACLRIGGFGLLEHPADPSDEEAASIWRLTLMVMLAMHPDVETFIFEQGPLGAASRKPTRLMAARLPTLRRRLDELADPRWVPPRRRMVGRTADGAWVTGQLKEYPQKVCAGMAHAVLDAVGERREVDAPLRDEREVEELREYVEALSGPADAGVVQPDFAGVALQYAPMQWASCSWEETSLQGLEPETPRSPPTAEGRPDGPAECSDPALDLDDFDEEHPFGFGGGFDDDDRPPSQAVVPAATAAPVEKVVLSEEQKRRIHANRQEALRRRRALVVESVREREASRPWRVKNTAREALQAAEQEEREYGLERWTKW